jgi:hypothetical protein
MKKQVRKNSSELQKNDITKAEKLLLVEFDLLTWRMTCTEKGSRPLGCDAVMPQFVLYRSQSV